MSLEDVTRALKFLDWSELLTAEDGTTFPVSIDGEFVTATKVFSQDKEDSDYDRDLTVVVEISGKYYRKHGWSNVGSHCYGDYEPSWDRDLVEVTPTVKTVTVWQ